MATFFGEVILPTSRVFFNENEDSDPEESPVEQKETLEIKMNGDNITEDQYELLIIAEGFVARGVSDLYLLNDKCLKLAEFYINNKTTMEDGGENIQQKNQSSFLFKLNSKTLLLQISSSVDLSLANQLMLKIVPWIEKCKKILILCSKAQWKYRCESADSWPPSFVRTLATSAFNESLALFNTLEQPNFITGFSASVMSWCECKKKSCILHVNYTDKQVLDSITLAPLLKMLNAYQPQLIVNNPDLSKLGISYGQSFMYM